MPPAAPPKPSGTTSLSEQLTPAHAATLRRVLVNAYKSGLRRGIDAVIWVRLWARSAPRYDPAEQLQAECILALTADRSNAAEHFGAILREIAATAAPAPTTPRKRGRA